MVRKQISVRFISSDYVIDLSCAVGSFDSLWAGGNISKGRSLLSGGAYFFPKIKKKSQE